MTQIITINQSSMIKYGLTISQMAVLNILLSDTKEKITRKYIVESLRAFKYKDDTVYRIIESLKDNKIITFANDGGFLIVDVLGDGSRKKIPTIGYKAKKVKRTGTKHGFVYVFKSENGRYKIGESSNPLVRLRTLRNASGESHEMVMSFKVNDCIGHETALHKLFSKKRKHSEWFELELSDLLIIEKYFEGLTDERK